jgi:hypothetical protein
LLAAVLLAGAISSPAATAHAAVADTLAGTVYLPDGTPAPAAIVDLMLADPTGQPVPGSAFARGVSDLEGHFSVNPRERVDLIAAAKARGGDLPIAVQVGKLAEHASLDPTAAAGSRVPDVALAIADITMRLATDSSSDVGGVPGVSLVFLRDAEPIFGEVSGVLTNPVIHLGLVKDVWHAASVFGMVNDPDLVAGNDNPNDPDLIPPLGSILADIVPIPDTAVTSGGQAVGGGVPSVGGGYLSDVLPHPDKESGGSGSCGKDPETRWVSNRDGNAPDGTKTYVYLDTFSCTGDNDDTRDEVIYKWGGYTGSADTKWTIYRLKYRTEIGEDYDYRMKYPKPVGDQYASSNNTLNWAVGWDFMVTATIGDSYHFARKKIHGWQGDGTGRLYHVSWISDSSVGSYGTGFNDGGGVNLEVPEGNNGRTGVTNEVLIWRCWWPEGHDALNRPGFRGGLVLTLALR